MSGGIHLSDIFGASIRNSISPRRRISLIGIRLDRASPVALPQQIAAQMRDGILRGTLPAGTQFLGSREIARELGCSRMVVLSAWDILYAEGYLESMPRGGVSVATVHRSAEVDKAAADRTGSSVDAVAKASIATMPAGRYARPQEFADMVVCLASERASYVTGTMIRVDGGLIRSV